MKKEAATAVTDGAATPVGAGITAAAVNMVVTAGTKVKESVQGEVQAVAGPPAGQPAGGVRLEEGREVPNLPLPGTLCCQTGCRLP